MKIDKDYLRQLIRESLTEASPSREPTVLQFYDYDTKGLAELIASEDLQTLHEACKTAFEQTHGITPQGYDDGFAPASLPYEVGQENAKK